VQLQATLHKSRILDITLFFFLSFFFWWKFCDVAKVVIIPRKRVKFCYIPDMKVKEHINCSILLAIYRNLLWKSGKFGPFLPWKTLCAWFKTIFFRSKIGKTLPIKWNTTSSHGFLICKNYFDENFWCNIFSVGIFGATHCHEWFALIPTLVILMQGIVRNDGFYSYYICKALGVVHWNFPKIWTQAQFVHGMGPSLWGFRTF